MSIFSEQGVIQKIAKYLPHQAPLKDFVHHNTLSSFQELHFEDAISRASKIFGYKTSLNIEEYRELYKNHLIREDILEQVIIRRKGSEYGDEWIHNLFHKEYINSFNGRLDQLRNCWKKKYHIDFEHEVNTVLFKLLGGYLDQGISKWHFPMEDKGFLASVRNLDLNNKVEKYVFIAKLSF